jgi:hypothetical protein
MNIRLTIAEAEELVDFIHKENKGRFSPKISAAIMKLRDGISRDRKKLLHRAFKICKAHSFKQEQL